MQTFFYATASSEGVPKNYTTTTAESQEQIA